MVAERAKLMLTRCGILAACSMLVAVAASAQTFEPNVNRWGSDYRSFEPETPDARLCQKACIDEVACLAWTYDQPGASPAKHGKCWLKHAIPAAARNSCCTSGIVRSAAGMKVAHAGPAFEKHGLLGTFAASCDKPVSASNPYVVRRALDGERIQSDVMSSPTERQSFIVGEVATEPAPNQLTVDGFDDVAGTSRISYTLLLDGRRYRVLQISWHDGHKTVENGRYLRGDDKDRETPWVSKCE
jgi:PAN domain